MVIHTWPHCCQCVCSHLVDKARGVGKGIGTMHYIQGYQMWLPCRGPNNTAHTAQSCLIITKLSTAVCGFPERKKNTTNFPLSYQTAYSSIPTWMKASSSQYAVIRNFSLNLVWNGGTVHAHHLNTLQRGSHWYRPFRPLTKRSHSPHSQTKPHWPDSVTRSHCSLVQFGLVQHGSTPSTLPLQPFSNW